MMVKHCTYLSSKSDNPNTLCTFQADRSSLICIIQHRVDVMNALAPNIVNGL